MLLPTATAGEDPTNSHKRRGDATAAPSWQSAPERMRSCKQPAHVPNYAAAVKCRTVPYIAHSAVPCRVRTGLRPPPAAPPRRRHGRSVWPTTGACGPPASAGQGAPSYTQRSGRRQHSYDRSRKAWVPCGKRVWFARASTWGVTLPCGYTCRQLCRGGRHPFPRLTVCHTATAIIPNPPLHPPCPWPPCQPPPPAAPAPPAPAPCAQPTTAECGPPAPASATATTLQSLTLLHVSGTSAVTVPMYLSAAPCPTRPSAPCRSQPSPAPFPPPQYQPPHLVPGVLVRPRAKQHLHRLHVLVRAHPPQGRLAILQSRGSKGQEVEARRAGRYAAGDRYRQDGERSNARQVGPAAHRAKHGRWHACVRAIRSDMPRPQSPPRPNLPGPGCPSLPPPPAAPAPRACGCARTPTTAACSRPAEERCKATPGGEREDRWASHHTLTRLNTKP